MHAGRFKLEEHKKVKIEIVPLIDLMFFLLATFIMVSLSMTKNQGMNVQLPAASSAAAHEGENKSITLTVMESGEVFYNKEKLTLAQLPFKLQSLKAADKDPHVIVNAAGNANFRYVVAVLDEARKLGIAKVGISTTKK